MVDMEEDEAEPIVDIDSCDKRNPLAVTEYIDDIYSYYNKVEVIYLFPLVACVFQVFGC